MTYVLDPLVFVVTWRWIRGRRFGLRGMALLAMTFVLHVLLVA